jgi:GT2 family glycosyltransferase
MKIAETETRVADRRHEDGPTLSIVIVSWNTRDALYDCLTSIFTWTRSTTFEVIVVDNDSADSSAEMVSINFPTVTLVGNPSNVGFARACNQGMRISKSPLILLLNSDTFVRDDAISRASEFLLANGEFAMAGCQLQYPDGRVQHTANRALGICRSLFEDLWLYKFVSEERRTRILLGGYWNHDSQMEIDWLAGAFMLLRRELFELTDGFCEDFFMYGEDSEWCARVKRAGGRIVFAPVGVIFHLGCASSDQVYSQKERLRLCHIGGVEAYSRTHGRFLGFIYHLTRLFGATVRLAVYSLLVRWRPQEYYEHQSKVYQVLVHIYAKGIFRRRYSRPAVPATS